jgi:hypothetical protein
VILLCGVPSEQPLALVQQRLHELEAPFVVLDQRNVDDTDLEFKVSDSGVTGELNIGSSRYALEEFSGVYTRLMASDSGMPADISEVDAPRQLHCHSVYDTLLAWIEISPAKIVNRCSAMGSNFSKPYQTQLIQAQGFNIPETLITNDPDLVREFWRKHKQVIYKSISSVRSIVHILREEDLERLEYILWCPTQFQAFIDGTNVRVHTIGQSVYASAIVTDAIDYRYAYRQRSNIEMHGIDLPRDVAERCVRLAATLELPFAGIDLIVTAQNAVYCLEVNPSPAYSYYERQTGQPISRTLALYLSGMAYDIKGYSPG